MSFEQSEVMNEFFELVKKQNLLKTAAAEKNPYQEDIKTIEEKRIKTPEKGMMEIAHPDAVYVAESQGDGALVENNMEQQKKLIEVINKMPTGSLVHRYATIANELVVMANRCDEVGQTEMADLLTDTAKNIITIALKSPFDKAPVEK